MTSPIDKLLEGSRIKKGDTITFSFKRKKTWVQKLAFLLGYRPPEPTEVVNQFVVISTNYEDDIHPPNGF